MRFKLLAAAALAVGLVVLAGCINYDQELTLNPDGSGFIMVHYNSAAQSAPGTAGTAAAGAEITTGQAPKLSFTEAEILKEYEGSPVKVRDIKIETLENVPNATYFIDFKNVNDLNGKGVFALEGDKLKQTFSIADAGANKAFKQLVQLKMDVQDPSTLSSYKFTYKLTCPGEVVETNGTKGDGNTVKWEYTLDKLINKDVEMTCTYKAGKAGMGGKVGTIIGIIVCVVIIVVIIILIVVLVSKKKKKGPAAPAAPAKPAA